MNELLKLSIEELEHVLAIAPYSEMHQMAYAIKKNQHDKGSMFQVMEGNYHYLKITQDQIAEQVISGASDSIKASTIELMDDIMQNEISDSARDSEGFLIERSDLKPVTNKRKKKKEEKTEGELELIESKDINLVGDVSSFILPDKTKEKKKIKKKKKFAKSKKKSKKGSKKKDKKSNKPEQIEDVQSSTSERDLSGLSDFSTWLLAQSKESHISPLKEKSKKKKKKKLKQKLKKKSAKKKKKKNKNLVSEPLADLLASQGHIEEAVEMYQKLSLIIPEKSAFFAAKIDKIQKET
ncbi:MAG: hypothetical protein HKN68_05890 [Saprospiraceae bacterium]|nr:hypothetical protein [Saprospiraceae bacterium]